MERNLKLLYTCVFFVVAALVGCGGGSDPQTMNPGGSGGFAGSAGSSGTGGFGGSEVDGDVCAKSLGGKCDEEGAVDPCTNYICACGEWQDPNNINCPDAGVDAEPDAEPDSDTPDAEPDVVQPDAPPPPEEICGNGKDDDSNGKADCQDDACAAELKCQDEVCDGTDNNGNGQADEGFACVYNSTASCQTTCGSFGTMQCGSGCEWGACTPPVENCTNTVDDNCDGKADCEDPSCASHAMCQCDAPTVGDDCYYTGEFSCDPDIRCNCSYKWDYTSNTSQFLCGLPEVCNGFDDNGNNVVDEGFACIKNTKQDCTTSCGSSGRQTCDSTCNWGSCQPPVENCTNGADDDCDGKADCADPDCSGLLACQDEVCDGADNNGNGQADEGFECIAGSIGTCTNSCGFAGGRDCSDSCIWGACIAFENCYSGGDEDCDGKADCADSDCSALPICQPENCTNGVDDNGNNLVDCADPQCSGLPICNPVEICDNNVDDDGDNKTDCNDPDCATAANCQPENCTNGADDDGDGKADCDDPDCTANVACHDFGTCSAQGAPGVGYECGTWTLDNTPWGIAQIQAGCANSEFDQWAMGDDYGSARALHLTGNHTWSEVTLPVPGHGGSAMDVICLGQSQVFISYTNDDGGVVLHWNGSSFERLMANELEDLVVMTLWGTGADNLWFFGFDNSPIEALPGYMYHWNGSGLTRYDLPDQGSKVFRGYKLFGEQGDLYLAGFEADPDDWDNNATHVSALLHWDGYSWAKVPGSDSIKAFIGIHGSSSCDIMAVGGKHTANGFVGATFQRNGNQWVTETHDSLSAIASVVKASPYKFVLQGAVDQGVGLVVMGTPSSTGNINWSSINEQFYNPGASWKVPNTSPQVYMSAGYASSGAQIWRTSCQ